MPVSIHTWTQRHFDKPGRALSRKEPQADPGHRTVAELSCLAPDPYTGSLRRAPGWSSGLALPSGLTSVNGIFYDAANLRYCFIGQGSGNMVLAYTTDWATWSSVYTILSSKTLRGHKYRNCHYWGGWLWTIASDNSVYRNTDYTAAQAVYYAGGNAVLIEPMNDRMWGALDDGRIVRQGTTDLDLNLYANLVSSLDVQYMIPFRQYMLIIAAGYDDRLHLYRLPDFSAQGIHELGALPHPGYIDNGGCPYALFQDKIYIATGHYDLDGTNRRALVYAFDGRDIEPVAHANADQTHTTQNCGLLVWNGKLLYYDLDVVGQVGHRVDVLVGDQFQEFAPLTGTGGNSLMNPFIAAIGDDLIICSRKPDTNHYAFRAIPSTRADGYFTTPALDLGRPGALKKLNTFTVILDDSDADFTVTVSYKIDDAAAWTSLIAATASTRIVTAENLNLDFYLIQFKVALADGTSPDESLDIGIEAISAVYSVGR